MTVQTDASCITAGRAEATRSEPTGAGCAAGRSAWIWGEMGAKEATYPKGAQGCPQILCPEGQGREKLHTGHLRGGCVAMFPFRSGAPAPERGERRGAWGRPEPPGEGPKRIARQLALAARRRRRRWTAVRAASDNAASAYARLRRDKDEARLVPASASERSRITRGPFGPMRLASSLCLRPPLARLHSATASANWSAPTAHPNHGASARRCAMPMKNSHMRRSGVNFSSSKATAHRLSGSLKRTSAGSKCSGSKSSPFINWRRGRDSGKTMISPHPSP